MTTVTMQHIRQCKMCAKGTRAFFKRHDMDWNKFLNEGLPASEFIRTGDAMAMKVVKVAENGR